MTAKHLYLVRHGEAEGWRPGMLLGSTDSRLSEAGRLQATAVRAILAPLPGARFLSSPLVRARETATIITEGRGLILETDPDLREMDFGEWEGLTFSDAADRDPEAARAWSDLAPDFVFPGGESLAHFADRAARVASRLAAGDAETVVAVTHGGVIRALICHFLGLSLREYLLFDIVPGSVTTLRVWNERGVLAGLWQPGGLAGEAT